MRGLAIGLLLAGLTVGARAQPSADPAPFASEIATFAEADTAHPPKQCRLLFVGSSSIRLWDSLSNDMAPHRVVNRGFGGSTIADVNRYFDVAVGRHRPRAIFFYAGENDVAAGNTPAEVTGDFNSFLKKKDEVLGPTPVYFISLKPSKARFAQLGQQEQVNAAIRQLAARRSDLHYIDVASAMLDGGKPRDIFQADALHMTAEGYRIWTRIIRPQAEQAAKRECR
jgi:lysophospholipase L1-like esterase